MPPNPLTAAGLATPYRLIATNPGAGACHETNANQSAFVEAAIVNPTSGQLSVYHPLVIDNGTQPAIAPVRIQLPTQAAVAVWFGFQVNTLSLRLKQRNHRRLQLRLNANDRCVNGAQGSPFGQFAYCGAPQFFAAANTAIRAKRLTVPALGTARDGKPCPTTRDFSVVDQDQSDNLPTKYLALTDGRTAQFSAANQGRLAGSTVLTNASDNGLLDSLIDPALGCRPFTAPDLSANGTASPALALNELQAAARQGTPVALVPSTDPMTQVNNQANLAKTNLYRVGVDQRPGSTGTTSGKTYCTNLGHTGAPRLADDQQFTSAVPSPDPAAGATLFDFLVQRFNASWTNLTCQQLTGQGPPAIAGSSTASTASSAFASPPTAADSAAPTDTTGAVPGEGAAPTDTTGAAPAEGAAPTDSTGAAPAEGAAPTDTTGAAPAEGAAPTDTTGAGPAEGAAPTDTTGAGPAEGAAPTDTTGAAPAEGAAPTDTTGAVPAEGAAPTDTTGAGPAEGAVPTDTTGAAPAEGAAPTDTTPGINAGANATPTPLTTSPQITEPSPVVGTQPPPLALHPHGRSRLRAPR